MTKRVLTFCPKCGEETLEFEITASGDSFDGEVTSHWFQGDAVCSECGWSGFHSESSV